MVSFCVTPKLITTFCIRRSQLTRPMSDVDVLPGVVRSCCWSGAAGQDNSTGQPQAPEEIGLESCILITSVEECVPTSAPGRLHRNHVLFALSGCEMEQS